MYKNLLAARQEMSVHIWEYPEMLSNMDSESSKSKGLAKRNPKEIPHKNNFKLQGCDSATL